MDYESFGPDQKFKWTDYNDLNRRTKDDELGFEQFLSPQYQSVGKMKELYKQLYQDKYVDDFTNILRIDFATYNPHIDLVSYLVFTFEFTDGGSVEATYNIDSFRFSLYNQNEPYDAVRMVLELSFFFLFLQTFNTE